MALRPDLIRRGLEQGLFDEETLDLIGKCQRKKQ
jgi:hypothetical protein